MHATPDQRSDQPASEITMGVAEARSEAHVRIVITGATGNVGTSLLERLATESQPPEVVGLARRLPVHRTTNVSWHRADIATDDLRAAFRGADAVVHLAWLIRPSHDPWTLWNTNVIGTTRVLNAAAEARVRAVVHMSSVGAYSPAPRQQRVDEHWPTHGIPTLEYSWQKAYAERLVDRFEKEHPEVRTVRLRPALIFKAMSGPEVQRLFLGPLVPTRLARPGMAGLIARVAPLQFQTVHSLDVADALARAVMNGDASGPFNITAEPVLGRDRAIGQRILRTATAAAWHSRLAPASPGWIDLARRAPMMSAERARHELGWDPQWSTQEALADLLAGFSDHRGGPTPALAAEGHRVPGD
ncbi:MAG: NAD-dependent epimerase/dehydratase [Acidimicrobiia bacterium]|nr:NAD-dependent epimerase/dehydratase [Acidimicrobiia bacterium]